MLDHNDAQSKGATSAEDVDITDHTTVDKSFKGKFVLENLLLIFHINFDKQ